MDLQSLTIEDVDALVAQGITPEQIAQIATEQGQPIPPIIQDILAETADTSVDPKTPIASNVSKKSKTNKFPAMMDVATYGKYKAVDKIERKAKLGAHKPNVFGYEFSDLISEEILRDMKKTQGSFFVGVNLSNLFNEFKNMAATTDSTPTTRQTQKKDKTIFNRIGEWIDVDFDSILDKEMGFRGSDVPMIPEKNLTEYSSFYEIIDESKKYSNKSGFEGNITPYGLIVMTRMLYKYKKTNAQWIRVATILELIFKYLNSGQSREEFFKGGDEIPILALMDLEEFYNTDHIFMTENELIKFKKDLNFYKFDIKIDINKKITEIRKKPSPPI